VRKKKNGPMAWNIALMIVGKKQKANSKKSPGNGKKTERA